MSRAFPPDLRTGLTSSPVDLLVEELGRLVVDLFQHPASPWPVTPTVARSARPASFEHLHNVEFGTFEARDFVGPQQVCILVRTVNRYHCLTDRAP